MSSDLSAGQVTGHLDEGRVAVSPLEPPSECEDSTVNECGDSTVSECEDSTVDELEDSPVSECEDSTVSECKESIVNDSEGSTGNKVEEPQAERKYSTSSDVSDRAVSGHAVHRNYDTGLATRNSCLVGLGFIWLIIVGLIVILVLLFISSQDGTTIDGAANAPGPHEAYKYPIGFIRIAELDFTVIDFVLPLLPTAGVMLCNECLGYIHSIALRWALWHEGRLHFNTKLRLLTNCRTSKPNRWYCNLCYFIAMAWSYTATSRILAASSFETAGSRSSLVLLNGFALLILCLGLFVQAAIASWSIYAMFPKIHSWNANMLNTALIGRLRGLEHEPDRSIRSLASFNTSPPPSSPAPTQPNTRQTNFWQTRRSVRTTTGFVAVMVVTTVIWASIMYTCAVDSAEGLSLFRQRPVVTVVLAPILFNSVANEIPALIIISLMQLYLTLGLHGVELLVNTNRDENAWRQATRRKGKGALLSGPAWLSALTSWEVLFLGSMKIVLHWVFGQALTVTSIFATYGVPGAVLEEVMYISSFALFIMIIPVGILLLFALYLAFHRPSGPQPAAFGHLQTLVNLIDDWGHDGEGLYWGDKGLKGPKFPGVRKAGTSGDPKAVGEIQKQQLYL